MKPHDQTPLEVADEENRPRQFSLKALLLLTGVAALLSVPMADGSVRFLSNDTPGKTVSALMTANGGETVDPSW